MTHRILFILPLSTLLASACTPTTSQWPTEIVSVDQAVQTQLADKATPPSIAVPASPTTESQPELQATVTINQTSLPARTLAGLIFSGGDLRQVQADGSVSLLYGKPVDVLSPDRQYTLVISNADLWLTTLSSGNIARLTLTETNTECCATWWTGHADKLLFLSNGLGKNNGTGTQGYLTMVKQDGTGYRVLDPDHPSAGTPAVSPDGTWIAYGYGESGWLFGGELGPQQVNPSDYGLVSIKGQTISYPSWSPDGRYLAWAWQSDLNSGSKLGVLVVDMEQKTYRLGSLFTTTSAVNDLQFRWSPDGKWLAYQKEISEPEKSGTYLIRMDSPDLAEIQVPGASLVPQVWDSDSRQLILLGSKTPDLGVIYLLDASTWQLTRMGFEQYLPTRVFAWN
jgi:Tol biopolymer transport system component